MEIWYRVLRGGDVNAKVGGCSKWTGRRKHQIGGYAPAPVDGGATRAEKGTRIAGVERPRDVKDIK